MIYTCKFWDRTPATMSISCDVVDEFFILFRRPKPSFDLLLVAARVVPHFSQFEASKC